MLLFFSLTLFVSAALMFFVQPMIGKMILPRLGGTPAVWNTCMVFFQAMLLVGYAYTHALSTWHRRRRQLLVQAAILALPLVVLPFAVGDRVPPADTTPVFWLLWLLVGMVGLPFFVVATTAPLLQKWFATTGHPAAKDPYFLYGASNLGSMLGLLLYPALIEPAWDVETQAIVWTAAYVLFALLVLGCALLVWRTPEPAMPGATVLAPPPPPAAPAAPAAPTTAVVAGRRRGARLAPSPTVELPHARPVIALRSDTITLGRRLRWVLLAAIPTSLMLGVTTYLTTDIAAVPFFWVVPLALYLLTFILVFARWPAVWTDAPHTLVLYLQPCFLLFLVLRIVSHLTVPLWGDFALHLCAFFATTLVCHGELAKDRPSARHLTEFYLLMSVGGVLGGVFNTFVAPVLFPYGIVEYPLAMVLACLVRPYMVQDVASAHALAWPRRIADAPILAFDAFLFALGMTSYTAAGRTSAHRAREVGSVRRFVQSLWPSSSAAEIAFDLIVPIAFGAFALWMVHAGDHASLRIGSVVLKRSYLMAGTVVVALAMAMRPVRFGLSVGVLLLVVALWDRSYDTRVFEDRGFFGLVRVKQEDDTVRGDDGKYHVVRTRRTLIHGGINHGQQFSWPEELRREPITYFHPTNGIGEIFHKLTWGNPPGKAGSAEHKAWLARYEWSDPPTQAAGEPHDAWNARYRKWFDAFSKQRAHFLPGDARLPATLVGLGAVSPWAQVAGMHAQVPFAVVGLGTGTLACHGQPYQHVDFYEIDPMVKRLSVPPSKDADDLIFTYVDDALKRGTRLDVIMGDGRLRVKDAPAKYYHAILLDAFSSDAVPVHLLTKDAVELYLDKLADGGVLIFNTTNRYVNLPPVLARIAEELSLECLHCPDWSNDWFPEKFGADWVALRRRDRGGAYSNGGPSLLDRLQVSPQRWQPVAPAAGRAWSDSYSNMLGAMRW